MVAKPFRRFVEHYRLSHDRREVFVAAIVWGAVVLYVPLSRLFDYWRSDSLTSVEWDGLADDFLSLIPFAVLFVVNDLFLSNVIVRLRKVVLYVILAVLSALFMSLVVEVFRSSDPEVGAAERDMCGRPVPPELRRGGAADSLRSAAPRTHDLDPFDHGRDRGDFVPPKPLAGGGMDDPERFMRPDDRFRPDDAGGRIKRPASGFHPGPMMSDFILALMMMCASTLVKVYLIADRDKSRLRQLDKARVEAELAQLRYQISPHFLMNTLNNIHALVDIDPDRAKDTIVRLSRLMRYMLHESSAQLVPLSSEVAFLSDYVELMRIRFADSVAIRLSMPSETDGVSVPPLLFINVVENAFKHGVSYAADSFVDIKLSLLPDRDELNFCCVNSLAPARPDDGHHGIGLANTRKRLDLLCHGRYQLSELKLDDRFVVNIRLRLA